MKDFLLRRNTNFGILLTSTLLTQIGKSIMGIAILWSVFSLTDSPILVGLITAVQVLPVVIFSFYSGILADTSDNKRIMLASDFSSFITLILIVFAWNYLDGVIQLVILYILVFLLSCFSSFFQPSFQATIKNTVDAQDLGTAYSLIQSVKNFSNIFGLLLGGVLVATIGISNSFIVNSICFLLSGVLILFSKIPRHEQEIYSKKIKDNIKESFLYLKKSSSELKKSLFFIIIINFSVAPMSIIMTILADDSNFGSVGLSFLNISFAIGSLLGSLLAIRLIKIFSRSNTVFVFILIYSISVLVATISSSILFSMVSLFITGISSSLILVFVNTFIQRETSNEYIGRISSIRSIALRIPPPIVSVSFGFVVSYLGLKASTLLLQLITITLGFLVVIRYKRGDNYGKERYNK